MRCPLEYYDVYLHLVFKQEVGYYLNSNLKSRLFRISVSARRNERKGNAFAVIALRKSQRLTVAGF